MSFWTRYTVQINGQPVSGNSYTGQYGSLASTKNNTGAIRFAGNIQRPGTAYIDQFTTSQMGEGDGPFNTVQNFSGEAYPELVRTTQAITGVNTTFAVTTAKNYQILGLGVANTIAGLSSTLLSSAGQDFGRRMPASVVTLRTSFLQSLAWSISSGTGGLPDYSGVVVGNTGNMYFQDSSITNPANQIVDIAANASLTNPGNLTYSFGPNNPFLGEFQPKLG